MASSPELDLLVKVVEEGGFKLLEDKGVDQTWFASDDGVTIYQYLRAYYNDEEHYGETPSLRLLRRWFSTCPLPRKAPRDSIDALVAEVRKRKLRREWNILLDDLDNLANEDEFHAAQERLASQMEDWKRESNPQSDLVIGDVADKLEAHYSLVQAKEGMLGIPTPWKPLNEGSMGLQGGDFVLIYGRPGTMKTWMSLCLAVHAYTKNRRVLYFSAEMTDLKIMQRMSAILARVDWDAYRHAELPPYQAEDLFQCLRDLRDQELEVSRDGTPKPELVVSTGRGVENGRTAQGIREKIMEYWPVHMVVVDGVYLLDGKGRTQTEKVAGIGNAFQNMSISLDIPIIAVTQATRDSRKGRGDDVGEVAHSDALGQAADIAFRVVRHWDEEEQDFVLTLVFSKGRDGAIPAFSLRSKAAYDFSVCGIRGQRYVSEAVARETASINAENEEEPPGSEPPSNSPEPVKRTSFKRRKPRKVRR